MYQGNSGLNKTHTFAPNDRDFERSNRNRSCRGGNQDESRKFQDKFNPWAHEIIVKGLSYQATENDVRDFFAQYGDVISVNIERRLSGDSKGSCFVKFKKHEGVVNSIKDSGVKFLGRQIWIDKTRSREERMKKDHFKNDRSRKNGSKNFNKDGYRDGKSRNTWRYDRQGKKQTREFNDKPDYYDNRIKVDQSCYKNKINSDESRNSNHLQSEKISERIKRDIKNLKTERDWFRDSDKIEQRDISSENIGYHSRKISAKENNPAGIRQQNQFQNYPSQNNHAAACEVRESGNYNQEQERRIPFSSDLCWGNAEKQGSRPQYPPHHYDEGNLRYRLNLKRRVHESGQVVNSIRSQSYNKNVMNSEYLNNRISNDLFTGNKGIKYTEDMQFEVRQIKPADLRNQDSYGVEYPDNEVLNSSKTGKSEYYTRDNNRKEAVRSNRSSNERTVGNNKWRKHENRPMKSKIVFVGNLNYRSSKEGIWDFFGNSGRVVDVRVATNRSGSKKGFAHVEFEKFEDAEAALSINGKKLDGRELRVDLASPSTRKQY